MTLLKPITLTLLTTTALFSQTTMCFKENHPSMSTIESTKLDGGECKSTYSLSEMKDKGWKVEDIKVSTNDQGKFNFIYILKDSVETSANNTFNSTLSEKQLEDKILKRLEEKKLKEQKAKEEKIKTASIDDGKLQYTAKCQSCHGQSGERIAYNVGSALKDLSVEDMSYAINRYTNEADYGYGYQVIMRPIAGSVRIQDLENIKAYLDSINK